MKKISVLLVLGVILPAAALATVKGIEVEYGSESNMVLRGYMAFDDAITKPRPGILVVHEWWGHTAYARRRARMLAELGYTALAVDMYGEGRQTDHPETAGKFASEVRKRADVAERRFRAALELLQQHPTTNPEYIAAIGYCFGGGVVLHMARLGMDLDAVVSFHGSLDTETPAQPGQVKAKILICHGADDSFVSTDVIAAFKKEMTSAGVDFRFHAYPEAAHSFTNPDADAFGKKFELPLKYSKTADEESWADMQAFLRECFKDGH